ncbi:MAG: helix-turn-helix transcriptional regulator [Clostridia bacterium]|nr:helix-turn-helix transcriptional regulator [Clostridia bacterium]
MIFSENFYLDIEKIHIAHKFILDRVHKCEYPSGRGHYGLVYVLNGKAEYRFFTGVRVTVTDGDVLLLSPRAAYSIVTEKEFKHYTVNFDIHEDTSRLDLLSKPYCLLQEENTEHLKRKFIELTNTWMSKKTGFEMESIGYLYELLSIFYFDCINRQNATSYHRLFPAKEYIEQYFHQPITLEELAKLSNMSITNFRREWKKLYSEAPLQYRDSIRLYYAKEYLNSGYYTVSEIAQKCGFDDVSYFVRFFKKNVGVTPGEFRKLMLRN